MTPGFDYTLLLLDANPYSPSVFGTVRGFVHLPAGSGGADGVLMVSESVWPTDPLLTQPLAGLSPPPLMSGLDLAFARLLVLVRGQADVAMFQPLIADPPTLAEYDPDDVTDWLAFGNGELAPLYASNGHNVGLINGTLGIDLLQRLIDKDSGRVIGRTNLPGSAIDYDTFYAGDPDPISDQFRVEQGQYDYTYTPGKAGLPLLVVPLPGDTDGDGDIDDADLANAFANFTGPVGAAGGKTAAQGDTDADGDVDDADLSVMFEGFTGALTTPVPAPGPVAILIVPLGLSAAGRRPAWRAI